MRASRTAGPLSALRTVFAALAALAALAAFSAAFALSAAGPAGAVSPPLSAPRIIRHFDLTQGQQPENIALEPDGSVDLTFSIAHQIARLGTDGELTVLATLPAPAHPATPLVGAALVEGIARAHDGTLFFTYATGTDDLTGIWRLRPGGEPERIAALPASSLPNGLALDEREDLLYSTDSALGLVWAVPTHGGSPAVWSHDDALKPTGGFGANGLKVHRHAVWAGNTDTGTLLRIPIRRDGSAGPAEARATGLVGIDDFAFPGRGDDLIAALDFPNEVVHVAPDGSHHTVLTRQDGLSNPTSVAVRGNTVYIPDAAYFTHSDPNLLRATIKPSPAVPATARSSRPAQG